MIVIKILKKFFWNIAINSKMSYSRYGMYEPTKPVELDDI